ncbi:MAG TPA: hypothetical protein V6D17_18940 [Candidatus Obscuribacterales bacterium]
MSGKEVANNSAESDKQSEVKQKTEKANVDVVDSMKARVELSKSDEARTKVKKFTLGDGSFHISGLDTDKGGDGKKGDAQKAERAPKDKATPNLDAGGRVKDDGFTPPANPDAKMKIGDVEVPVGEIRHDGFTLPDNPDAIIKIGDTEIPISAIKDDGFTIPVDDEGKARIDDIDFPRGTTDDGSTEDRDAKIKIGDAEVPIGAIRDDGFTLPADTDATVKIGDVEIPIKDIKDKGSNLDDKRDYQFAPGDLKQDVDESEHPEGSPRIERDGDRVKKITYPNGNTTEIEYDEKGGLKRIIYTTDENVETWQKANGAWKRYDKDHKEIPLDAKEKGLDFEVAPNGDVIATMRDGSTIKQNTDGSAVEAHKINGKDCVTKVRYPDGTYSEYEYDEKGRLTKASTADGSLERQKDGSWKHYDADHNEIKEPPGDLVDVKDVVVSPEGDTTLVDSNGRMRRQNHDGSKVETENHDGKQNVTKVVHPDGSTEDLVYDVNGELEEWTSSNPRETMKRREDGKWSVLDENGKETDVIDVADIKAKPNGDVTYTTKDGYTETWRADGTIHTKEGRTEIEYNRDHEATEIKHPNGTRTTIDYDGNEPAKPSVITRPDGVQWRREGDGWYEYKHGKPTGDTVKGDFEVQDDGDIVMTNGKGKRLEKWTPDGGKVEYPEDKPIVTRDGAGKVAEEVYKSKTDGVADTEYKYKDDKLVEASTADGRSWKKTGEGRWQQYNDGEPVGKPQNIDLKVAKNGDLVVSKNGEPIAIQHKDGSQTEFKWNGERETKDKDGRVTEVIRSDGSYTRTNKDGETITRDAQHRFVKATNEDGDVTRQVDYDKGGNPSKIVTEDGTFEKNADGAWVGNKGKPLVNGHDGPITGDLEVGRDGSITVTDRSYVKHTSKVDGTVIHERPDNTSVTESPTADGATLVREVRDAQGNTKSIKYDKDRNVVEIYSHKEGEEPKVLLGKNDDGKVVVAKPGTDEWFEVKETQVTDEGYIYVTTTDGQSIMMTPYGKVMEM